MTEKQVPEDQQFDFLREKLAGSDVLGRLRGKFRRDKETESSLGPLGQILAESSNPTDFCRRWDQFSSDARFMGNTLARFRRDGWAAAEHELVKVLENASYRLPGETIPLHETELLTVVVFDFERTLTMIRWIRCAHWMSLDNYLDELDDNWKDEDTKQRWFASNDRPLTLALFDAFPSLEERTRARRDARDREGRDLLAAYSRHVLADFDHSQLRDGGSEGVRLELARNTYNDHLELYHACFGYLVRGDQAHVLSNFNREEQERISTWSIRVPKVLAEERMEDQLVCFTPELAHGMWEQRTNAWESLGCSNEYGCVLMDRQHAFPLCDHTRVLHRDDVVSASGIELSDPDKAIAFELQRR